MAEISINSKHTEEQDIVAQEKETEPNKEERIIILCMAVKIIINNYTIILFHADVHIFSESAIVAMHGN